MGDNISIVLGSREVVEVEDYTVKLGIFEQPGAFDVTLGRGYQFRYLAEQFPPKTPYELLLGGHGIQVGLTDGFRFAGSNNRTAIHLRGRDPLGWLHDNKIAEELSFTDCTFAQLTDQVAEKSGLKALLRRIGREFTLIYSNEANRKAIIGTKSADSLAPKTTQSIDVDVGPGGSPGSRKTNKTIRGEVGTSWWDFLVKQYRRVGLFLWCAADGTFVLTTPKNDQKPIGRLYRKTNDSANIVEGSFENDTTQRSSEVRIYGRGIGNKKGVGKDVGRAFDDEVVAYLNHDEADRKDGGLLKIVSSRRDDEAESIEQANNLARREICEQRRNGWKLSYEIPSHSIVSATNSEERVFPMPDTVVDVDDDDFGLYGPMYVEGITLLGKSRATTTQLALVRGEDMFFENEVEKPKSKVKPTGIASTVTGKVIIFGIGIDGDRMAEPPGLSKGWQSPIPSGLDNVDRVKTAADLAPQLSPSFREQLVKSKY